MNSNLDATVVVFDVNKNFDIHLISSEVKKLSSGLIWNFIPGLFVFKTEMNWTSVLEKLKIDLPEMNFVVFQTDPAKVNGMMPPEVWDSWFLNLFWDDIDRIAKVNSWSEDYLQRIKQRAELIRAN